MDGTVIIADDDRNLRTVLAQALSRAGAKVRATATLSTLWRWVEEGEGDVVLMDVNLIDGNSLEILPRMKALRPELEFIVMSAQNTVLTAMRAEEAGAYEYLAKPFDLRDMVRKLDSALKVRKLESPETQAIEDLPLIGRSEVMQNLYRQISKMAKSPLPVLFMGNSGTGKSHIARVLHDFGFHADAPFIRLDGLHYDYEQFEYHLKKAEQGTVFIDHIDELSLEEQAELISQLENADFSARIFSSARSNLFARQSKNEFRPDLFMKISTLTLELPDLVDRIDDIEELAQHFLRQDGYKTELVDNEIVAKLQKHDWPGNLHELRASLQRAALLSNSDRLNPEFFQFSQNSRDHSELGIYQLSEWIERKAARILALCEEGAEDINLYELMLEEFDRPLIEAVLKRTGGNQKRAAEILGMNRNTLRKKIQNLDIAIIKSKTLE